MIYSNMEKEELYETLMKVLFLLKSHSIEWDENIFEAQELLEELINKTQFINKIS